MVKGFPYVAVLRHNEKETMPVITVAQTRRVGGVPARSCFCLIR